MTMIRPILIHIHIPKTAGSTLNAMISEGLGEHRQFICARDADVDMLAAMSQAERDRIDFIFGHYNYGLHRLFTRPIRYVSCLREPRQRIFSFYNFVVANEEHPLHAIVRRNSHDFSSFLQLAAEAPRIQDPVDNTQVRMLAGTMELRADYEVVLSLAKSHIVAEEFLLGDMEHLGDFFARLARTLQLEFGPRQTLNVSRVGFSFDQEMERLDSDAQEILKRFVKWDSALQSAAKEIAVERTSFQSDPVATSTAATVVSAGRLAAGEATMSATNGRKGEAHDDKLGSSDEIIESLYRAILRRPPDDEGRASCSQRLVNEGGGFRYCQAISRFDRIRFKSIDPP